MSFDNIAKRSYLPANADTLKLDRIVRSPVHQSLIEKDFRNNLRAILSKSPFDGHHRRESSAILQQTSFTTYKSPRIDTLRSDADNLERKTKKTPTKKYYFFSDYMKDFNPTPREYKSPVANISGASALSNQLRGTSGDSAGYYKVLSNQKEYILSLGARARSPEIKSPKRIISGKWKVGQSSPQGMRKIEDGAADRDKRMKENMKDDIRQRLSDLSGKLYSPVRSRAIVERRKSEITEDVLERAFSKESTIPGKDYSQFLTQEGLENIEALGEKREGDFRGQGRTGGDTNYPVMIQDYENSMDNSRSQLDKADESNNEPPKFKDDLITPQEQLGRRRIESSPKNKSMNGDFNSNHILEEQLRQEKTKSRQLEEQLEDSKIFYERKLADLHREVEKLRNEKDRKTDEINHILKTKTQSQRDIITKIKTENEALIKKLREEHNSSIRDFHTQVDKKNFEIEKLQREKGDLLNSLNEKSVSLQELAKSHQDSISKLNQTVLFKDNEIEKLSRLLNDAKKSYSNLNNRVEGIENERARLAEENERMKAKIARLEKTIYGKDKNSSPRAE